MRLAPIIILLFIATNCFAQFNYQYSVKKELYQPLPDTISINGTTMWDEESFKVPIGFSFKQDGTAIDSFYLLGPTFLINDTVGTIEGFWTINADLYDRGMNTTGFSVSPLQYCVTGMAGNRICKIEFANAGFWDEYNLHGTNDDYINLQIWLYEGSNAIEFRYGPSHVSHPQDYFVVCEKLMAAFIEVSITGDSVAQGYYLVGDPAAPMLDSCFDVDIIPDGLDSMPVEGTVYRFEPKSTSVKDNMHLASNVQVYPTVCYNELVIGNMENSKLSYRITTLEGKNTGLQNITDKNKYSIDVSSLATGMYILYLEDALHTEAKRFIKQ